MNNKGEDAKNLMELHILEEINIKDRTRQFFSLLAQKEEPRKAGCGRWCP